MATFTSDQQDQLRAMLGYAAASSLLVNELQEERSTYVINRAIDLVDELAAIDAQLTAARQDSMARSVGRLRLSYTQHVAHLKGEGSRLLEELSQMLGISILYNKYTKGQPISIRSYW